MGQRYKAVGDESVISVTMIITYYEIDGTYDDDDAERNEEMSCAWMDSIAVMTKNNETDELLEF